MYICGLQILDEMLDEGEPFNTETSILKEIVLPPTLSNRVRSALTGKGYVFDCLHVIFHVLFFSPDLFWSSLKQEG